MTSKYLTWAFTKVQTIKDTFRVTSRWDTHQKVTLFTLHAEEGVVAKDAAPNAAFGMFGARAA